MFGGREQAFVILYEAIVGLIRKFYKWLNSSKKGKKSKSKRIRQ